MVDWNNRSFVEMETSTGAERSSHTTAFGSPLIDDRQKTSNKSTDQTSNNGTEQASRTSGNGQSPFDTGNPNDSTGGQQTGGQRGGLFTVNWGNQQPVDNSRQQAPQGNQVITGRATYGGVAPSAIDATNPNRQGDGSQGSTVSGRATYGGVAPSALDATNPNRQQNPGDNGGRAGYGTSIDPATGQPIKPWGQTVTPDKINPGNSQVGGGRTGGGGSPVSDQQRAIINESLHKEVNMSNYLTWSMIGGIAGSGPIPYLMDRTGALINNHAPVIGEGLKKIPGVQSFVNEHSPARMQQSALRAEMGVHQQAELDFNNAIGTHQSEISSATAAKANAERALVQPEADFANNMATVDRAINRAHVMGPRAKSVDVAELWAQKETFFQTAKNANFNGLTDQHIDDLTLPGRKVTPDPKTGRFLTQAEADLLKQQRDLFGTISPLKQQVTTAETAIADANAGIGIARQGIADAQAAMAGSQAEIAQIARTGKSGFNFWGTKEGPWTEVGAGGSTAEKLVGEWRGNKWFNKMGEGLAVGATALAADAGFDYLFGHSQWSNKHDYFLEGPAVAAAMLWPGLSVKSRIMATAGSIGLAQAWDHFAPGAPSATYSKLMQPNWYDVALTSAAWMMPFKSPGGRIAAVAGAWGLARAADVAHNVFGLPVPGVGDVDTSAAMNDDLKKAIRADENSYTNSHFKDIVEKGKALGVENDAALMLQYSDFTNQHAGDQNPMYRLQGTAALSTAIADAWMEHGTKIDPTAHNDQARILKGTGIDLGAPAGYGDATTFYRLAGANLIEAQNLAIQQHAPQGQIDELKSSLKYVQDKLSGIYGKHDIEGAYNELKKDYRQNIDQMTHYQVGLVQRVNALQTSDPEYAAKMCRDVALLDLAIAGYKAQTHDEGGGAAIMYAEAQRYLNVAKKLQPNNPNNGQLDAIVNQLKGDVGSAIQGQNNSNIKNPFGAAPRS